MTNWIDNAIFWHIYPLGFVGAESDAQTDIHHRLSRIVDWLDYAVELGASGLLLGPIFASSSHGYDTIDHLRVDSRLGDAADFEALVSEAKRRGLRIILDGVFNHVGRDFPVFKTALANGTGSNEARWFRWLGSWDSAGGPDYATFEGHHALVTLNHESPEVAAYVIHVMKYWLARGASGWRLDAAYAVPRSFWANVVREVRVHYPDVYIFGEVIHGDYIGFVADTGVSAVTQYELWKAIWSALNDGNFFELNWALERHNCFLNNFVPQTFVGNHDVTRLASRLGDEKQIAQALAILFAIGGTPSIYAGDEQAFRGIKENRAGGDDAVRPAFPVTAAALAPFGWPIYRLHQQLIGLRRRHPWLIRAQSRKLHLTNKQLLLAVEQGRNCLYLALNLDNTVAIVPAFRARGVLAGAADIERSPPGKDPFLRLPAQGWAVLSVEGL